MFERRTGSVSGASSELGIQGAALIAGSPLFAASRDRDKTPSLQQPKAACALPNIRQCVLLLDVKSLRVLADVRRHVIAAPASPPPGLPAAQRLSITQTCNDATSQAITSHSRCAHLYATRPRVIRHARSSYCRIPHRSWTRNRIQAAPCAARPLAPTQRALP